MLSRHPSPEMTVPSGLLPVGVRSSGALLSTAPPKNVWQGHATTSWIARPTAVPLGQPSFGLMPVGTEIIQGTSPRLMFPFFDFLSEAASRKLPLPNMSALTTSPMPLFSSNPQRSLDNSLSVEPPPPPSPQNPGPSFSEQAQQFPPSLMGQHPLSKSSLRPALFGKVPQASPPPSWQLRPRHKPGLFRGSTSVPIQRVPRKQPMQQWEPYAAATSRLTLSQRRQHERPSPPPQSHVEGFHGPAENLWDDRRNHQHAASERSVLLSDGSANGMLGRDGNQAAWGLSRSAHVGWFVGPLGVGDAYDISPGHMPLAANASTAGLRGRETSALERPSQVLKTSIESPAAVSSGPKRKRLMRSVARPSAAELDTGDLGQHPPDRISTDAGRPDGQAGLRRDYTEELQTTFANATAQSFGYQGLFQSSREFETPSPALPTNLQHRASNVVSDNFFHISNNTSSRTMASISAPASPERRLTHHAAEVRHALQAVATGISLDVGLCLEHVRRGSRIAYDWIAMKLVHATNAAVPGVQRSADAACRALLAFFETLRPQQVPPVIFLTTAVALGVAGIAALSVCVLHLATSDTLAIRACQKNSDGNSRPASNPMAGQSSSRRGSLTRPLAPTQVPSVLRPQGSPAVVAATAASRVTQAESTAASKKVSRQSSGPSLQSKPQMPSTGGQDVSPIASAAAPLTAASPKLNLVPTRRHASRPMMATEAGDDDVRTGSRWSAASVGTSVRVWALASSASSTSRMNTPMPAADVSVSPPSLHNTSAMGGTTSSSATADAVERPFEPPIRTSARGGDSSACGSGTRRMVASRFAASTVSVPSQIAIVKHPPARRVGPDFAAGGSFVSESAVGDASLIEAPPSSSVYANSGQAAKSASVAALATTSPTTTESGFPSEFVRARADTTSGDVSGALVAAFVRGSGHAQPEP
eukprot:TRINITY_DN40749_c0_g1_i1.p1 TRINITY_DN40749_c0_g1~~TRINITY_DN40749_c0_g1_i1.p1  ORF type:complete len:1024 (-),score=120.10 TRINITY_DN40749_c0_g1_i1:169-2967(-)